MRTFHFILFPLLSYNSSILFLYKDSHPYLSHSPLRIPTLISCIPRIPIIPTLIPIVPTLIPCIPIIPTLIRRIPIILLILFPDSFLRLSQIVVTKCSFRTFPTCFEASQNWQKTFHPEICVNTSSTLTVKTLERRINNFLESLFLTLTFMCAHEKLFFNNNTLSIFYKWETGFCC